MAPPFPDLLEISCEPEMRSNDINRLIDPRRRFARSLVNQYLNYCTICHRTLWPSDQSTEPLLKRSLVRIPVAYFCFSFLGFDVYETILQYKKKRDFEKTVEFYYFPHTFK